MKGLFIPEITAEMFRNGCFESIEALMAEGEIYDIDYEPEQRWIPCSERLPENPKSNVDIKTYLVCFDDGNITDLMWCDGWNCCFNSKGMVSKRNELTGVIAWMPLPEPYREENNG